MSSVDSQFASATSTLAEMESVALWHLAQQGGEKHALIEASAGPCAALVELEAELSLGRCPAADLL